MAAFGRPTPLTVYSATSVSKSSSSSSGASESALRRRADASSNAMAAAADTLKLSTIPGLGNDTRCVHTA
eukprot:CAMPEP_0205955152 /NCGR_PEP_ID=MMETSP1459-20131121/29597_1 /ASSEMBLY_ACC=CAM_ASM_001120 /TAXON_ID=41880 /ORGANISM="Pycnococcus provasolii, Strain RCC931" /LENGTH=69 /DNA_ID=CAMNT_0053327467 /DNA_START=123 /DNA_END=332 /DNA_ORIENTATION=-